MVRAAEGLAARGVTTVTFDFAYVESKRRAPDRNDALEARYREVIDEARDKLPGSTLAIGGKSMGGRIASQIAAKYMLPIAALVFFGYPLHPPGKPAQRRDAHLPKIKVPMLFIQGARDAFGGEDEITPLAASLGAETFVVPFGDHSLAVPKKSGTDSSAVMERALDRAAEFILRF